MEIRKFSNLIFSLLGIFIVYSLLFKYTIGALFGINKLSVYQEFSQFSLNWNIFFIIVLCFTILIKSANILTYLSYQKNYIVELNETNQYRILKIIFVTFSLFRLVILFFTFQEIRFLDKIFSEASLIFFFTVLFHRTVVKFMIHKINSYSKIQSNYIFIFSMIPILFYFYFFWDYGFGSGSLNIFEFVFRPIIFFITLCSPLVFRLLLEKDRSITNYHFAFILFFWSLFLYNLQEFLLKFPNYKRDNMYLIKDLTFHVILPLLFLSLHSIFARIKTISTLQFALFILGILLVFCPIVRYLNGTSFAMYLYLISGVIILFLSQKTAFLDKRLEKLKFKNKIRAIEPLLQNSSSFLFIALLFLTTLKYFATFFDYRPSFTDLASFALVLTQLVTIGIIISKKNLKIDNVDDYINITITFFLTLIFCNNYLWYLSSLIFSNLSFFSIDTVCFIVLLLAIILSSYLTKLIKILLPKSYFKGFQS